MAGPLSDTVRTVIDGGGPLSDYSSTFLGYQPPTRTGDEIASQVRRLFGDEAGAQIVDSDLVSWINNAQDSISNVNRVSKARAELNSVTGVSTYAFPNRNIQQIESLHYNGTLIENVSYAQAEESGYIGRTPEGSEQPRVWWEFGGNFTFWPTPPDSQRISMRYTMRPTPIVNLTDTLGVPDKYFESVLIYAMQQAYELDENWNASQLKASQFEKQLDVFGEEERTAQNMLYESVTYVDRGW